MSSDTVRVRFAPSPTGYFHLGGARTALYDWLFARQNNGKLILRIEDTDRTRYQPDALSDLLEGMRWLELCWDEGPEVGGDYGPYYQSDRVALYQDYAQQLVDEGHAYRCYCSPERLASLRDEQRERGLKPGYDRHCRHLTQEQIAEYEAVNYEWIDATEIRAVFDLRDAPHGLYDVYVINPDGRESVLPHRYLVESAQPLDLTVGMGGPSELGLGETGWYGFGIY